MLIAISAKLLCHNILNFILNFVVIELQHSLFHLLLNDDNTQIRLSLHVLTTWTWNGFSGRCSTHWHQTRKITFRGFTVESGTVYQPLYTIFVSFINILPMHQCSIDKTNFFDILSNSHIFNVKCAKSSLSICSGSYGFFKTAHSSESGPSGWFRTVRIRVVDIAKLKPIHRHVRYKEEISWICHQI